MYEAGTRTPFILHWPARVTPGETNALVSHLDLYASLAALLGIKLQEGEAVDSINLLETFLGDVNVSRQELLTEGLKAKNVLRMDNWVYIPPYSGERVDRYTNIELGNASEPQLYNLAEDLCQRKNLATEYPGLVAEMDSRLKDILESMQTR